MARRRLHVDAAGGVMTRDAVVDRHVELREAGRRLCGEVARLILVAGEVKHLVAPDRAAAIQADLLFVKRFHSAREEALRVRKVAVAEEPEAGRARPVRSRLRDGVDDHTSHASVFRIEAIGNHLELLNVLLAVALVRSAAALAAHVYAVDLVLRHVVAAEAGPDRSRVAPRAGNERHEAQPVAPVERKAGDLFGIDVPG